ncbi:hypothetical protein FHX37_3561 [Haloactinospora alba]|uniref:Uncharacterized protein n=1 Tax=Haloactinospora alba TaxID=405555 RepID=A0A543NNX7_9ACTN|nr:hypothetical protein [Haloactinospora alba]TQN33539.1 hypothetical protein FHX37_3561 [Haloactinospora alba]
MSVDVGDRRRLTAALLGEEAAPPPSTPPVRVVRGILMEITPGTISIATSEGEERLLTTAHTTFWRGREVVTGELRAGDDLLVRLAPGSRWVAERVWAQLARVTGVIAERSGETLRVDVGHGNPHRTVTVPYRASGRIAVRYPEMEPGYLFDAVGVWQDGGMEALLPVGTQAPHPVSEAPSRPPIRRDPARLSGVVSWYDPAGGHRAHEDRIARLEGVAYPALERGTDCEPGCDRADSCAPLPLLSLGTTVSLRNDCSGRSAVLPVVDCAAVLGWFCDRCSTCDLGDRGRLAQLTLTSFVALGGQPEAGCVNATMTVG